MFVKQEKKIVKREFTLPRVCYFQNVIIVGVRDSLGITGSVGGLNDHQWYKGNDIQKCSENEMFHIVSHSRLIIDGCLFCLPHIISLSKS